jgi:hypothetical protein
MISKPNAAHLLVNIYILFVIKIHKGEIATDLETFAIFNNDIRWIIGGMARFAYFDMIEKKHKIIFINLIADLNLKLKKFQQIHVLRLQVNINTVQSSSLTRTDAYDFHRKI